MELYDPCVLCGEDVPDRLAVRRPGGDLCPACKDDLTHERLAGRDFALQKMRWTEVDPGGGAPRAYLQETIALPYRLSLRASFARETLGHKLCKLWFEELQIGEPRFDDTLFIETEHPEVLRGLLGSAGMRSVILDAVGELSDHIGPLQLEGNVVRLRREVAGTGPALPLLRHAALIAHHLEQFAVAEGLPRTDGAIRFPDLAPLSDPEVAARCRRLAYWADRLVDPRAFEGLALLRRVEIRDRPPA